MADFSTDQISIEDNVTKNRDLFEDVVIKILDYETTSNTFIRYCIDINIKSETHFWFEKEANKSWNCLRRYSEFVTLKELLTKLYPACLIPPLPSKLNSTIPWRLSNQINDTEFIESRRQRLEWFLIKLVTHPKLSHELIVLEFVKNGDTWNENATTIDQTMSNGVNWRWINVQSRLIQIFNATNSSSQMTDLLKSKSLSDESLVIVERGRHLQEHIQSLLNCLTKIEEQTMSMHHLYTNYSEAFHDWCGNDKDMGDALQSFGHLCENFSNIIDSPSTSNRMIVLTQGGCRPDVTYNVLTWFEITLLLNELYDYGESWIELAGRMALLHKQINRCTESIDDLTNQLDRLKKGQSPKAGPLNHIKNKFSKSPSNTDLDQLTKSTELSLFELNTTLISLKADKELFEKCVVEEVDHFESIRSRDLALVMHSYASNQLSYSQQCLRLWQRARQTVR